MMETEHARSADCCAPRAASGGDGGKKSGERVGQRTHPNQRAKILKFLAMARDKSDNVTQDCVSFTQAQVLTTQKLFVLSRRFKIMSPLFITLCHLLLLSLAISLSAANQNLTTVTTTTTTTTTAAAATTTLARDNSTTNQKPRDEPANHSDQFKLDCQPGEQRQFSYESSTKVWGSSDQQVRLRAILRLKCMEPPTNSSLKYLAEIVSVKPNFIYQDEPVQSSSKLQQPRAKLKAAAAARDAQFSTLAEYARRQNALNQRQATSGRGHTGHDLDHLRTIPREAEVDQMLRAEPLLEEVSEVAVRMKRSVSGWFSKAWVSVKDFFGNIFTSSERSSVSRDQVFKESGLDIAGQCKVSSSSSSSSSSSHKGKGGAAGLPFDESVFEDLGPEYYVGASLDGTSGLEFLSAGHVSTFGQPSGSGNDGDDDRGEDAELMTLSFFDDPPPLRRRDDKTRAKRATTTGGSSGGQKKSRTTGAVVVESGDHERLLRVPFVFIQSRSGKIIEIRFSGGETDLSVKNFKRHLCDLFATNLDWNKTTQSEVSPIGKHQTNYTLDASANSMDSMKRTMLDGGNLSSGVSDHEERTNKQQLVRVLATLGTSDRRFLGNNGNSTRPPPVTGGHDNGDGDDDADTAGDDFGSESDGDDGRQPAAKKSLSVLRAISTTSGIQQMGSKVVLAGPEIDRMQVRVKQVQQINEGRLVGTAGQLSMSLVQVSGQQQRAERNKRQAPTGDHHHYQQVEDISDLLKVSTSFSMQLVPIPRNPDGSIADDADADSSATARGSHRSRRSPDARPTAAPAVAAATRERATRAKKRRAASAAAVKLAPSDAQELQRVLQDWRKQEARLQLSSATLMSENHSSLQDSQTTRLDILRDQIRQRLNEEFVRNRIRRSLSMQQVAAAAAAASAASARTNDLSSDEHKLGEQRRRAAAPPGGDLGLGLTQLVLGTGVTSRRKGSIYGALEEVLELEAQLVDDRSESAVSRLMRDTLKMDKLRQHCRSAVPSLDELTSGLSGDSLSGVATSSVSPGYERRLPFGLKDDEHEAAADAHEGHKNGDLRARASRRARQVDKIAERNDRKFQQCQQMLRLLLKLSERQAVDLVLELIDECNSSLVAAARQEELGYGPVSKYLRRQRQQLVELLVHVGRPTESLLDKLLSRLYHYPKLVSPTVSPPGKPRPKSPSGGVSRSSLKPEPEFVYLTREQREAGGGGGGGGGGGSSKPLNKSLLREEDDFNNNDGAGLLVMTLTTLAAKSSIGRLKRLEVAEKLLGSLKGTTCSLFNAPDLDILESMASFQTEPLDEIVGRILQLARKCKQHDQYVVACVHALSGQLHHAGTQRLLADLLSSPNASCTVKSEVVLTLVGAQLNNDLKQQQQQQSVDAPPQDALGGGGGGGGGGWGWPSVGFNRVDEILSEIVDGPASDKLRVPDRRCLKNLASHYLSRKTERRTQQVVPSSDAKPAHSRRAERRSFRHRRAVPNEQNFWDDAQCKRWTMPADGTPLGSSDPLLTNLYSDQYDQAPASANNSSITDLIEEIDDNSILSAVINYNNRQQQQQQRRQGRTSGSSSRRQQKLVERELESSGLNATAGLAQQSQAPGPSSQNQSGQVFVQRRHKCVASKDFGPKNAQATLKAEIVNDLVGAKDENKFLARFRLATNFLGQRIDVGRMYLWHQRRTTRAYANILGRSIWDSSHGCKDKPPSQTLYMPLFDFSLWLVKISVGLRLNAEMGFFPNCDQPQQQPPLADGADLPPPAPPPVSGAAANATSARHLRYSLADSGQRPAADELQLYPTITLRAAGEATAKLVVARAGMSLASQYSYQGDIRVSRQPESCMSIYSAHQPMNITFSSWFQLWDNDCHFWGSRNRAEPQATKWRLTGRRPTAWLENECLASASSASASGSNQRNDSARLIPQPLNQISP